MARVRMLRDIITGERYFRDLSSGVCFRRVVGALSWPVEDKPGALIVLGETRSTQNALGIGRHDVHVLEEQTHDDVSMLLAYMGHMADDWLVRIWATPVTDKRTYMLDDLAADMRAIRRMAPRYADPQGWSGKGEGLMPFYFALVQRRTQTEKTLFFGQVCRAADEIGKLQTEDMIRKPTDFPAAAALFFALAEVDVTPYRETRVRGEYLSGPADLVGGY